MYDVILVAANAHGHGIYMTGKGIARIKWSILLVRVMTMINCWRKPIFYLFFFLHIKGSCLQPELWEKKKLLFFLILSFYLSVIPCKTFCFIYHLKTFIWILQADFPITSSREHDVAGTSSGNGFADIVMPHQDGKQNCVSSEADFKHFRKFQLAIASKDKLISNTALSVLLRKREQLVCLHFCITVFSGIYNSDE